MQPAQNAQHMSLINRGAHLLVRVLRRLRIDRLINLVVPSTCAGRWCKIPIINGLGVSHLEGAEPWMVSLLKRAFAVRSGVFLDVGINEGQTLVKVRALSETQPYVGFEPNSVCVAYVQQLVRVNDYRDVRVFPVALAAQSGVMKLQLYSDSDSDSAASLVAGFRAGQERRSLFVAAYTFTQLEGWLGDEPIGFVKVDVEGGEIEVLQGMEHRLQRDLPVIFLEILPVYSAALHSQRLLRQEALESLFQRLGYALYRVDKDERNEFRGLREVYSIGIHDRLDWSDYLACPPGLSLAS